MSLSKKSSKKFDHGFFTKPQQKMLARILDALAGAYENGASSYGDPLIMRLLEWYVVGEEELREQVPLPLPGKEAGPAKTKSKNTFTYAPAHLRDKMRDGELATCGILVSKAVKHYRKMEAARAERSSTSVRPTYSPAPLGA